MGRIAGASLDEIECVYRRRAAQLERVAAAIVGDREVARDVVQDAFATIVRRRRGYARRGCEDTRELNRFATANGRAPDGPLDAAVPRSG